MIPAADGLLAATALRHGLHVMTRNTKHFEASGALIIYPWQGNRSPQIQGIISATRSGGVGRRMGRMNGSFRETSRRPEHRDFLRAEISASGSPRRPAPQIKQRFLPSFLGRLITSDGPSADTLRSRSWRATPAPISAINRPRARSGLGWSAKASDGT